MEKVGKLEVKWSKKYGKKYLTFATEFKTKDEYWALLDETFIEYKKEVLSLPFKLKTKQSRKVFLSNLYDEFALARNRLDREYKKILRQVYDCINEEVKSFDFYCPRFCKRYYLKTSREAYHKIFVAYSIHKEEIDKAIEILNVSAENDGVKLKTHKETFNERIKTKLSSPELSYLFFILLQNVAEDKDFNRSQLSRLLANNFSTKRTLVPQANQIRKHFTEVNDSVKNNVEKLFVELSKASLL
jgi:hypothetical protein